MNPDITVEYDNDQFTPGEPVRGTVRWDADPSCNRSTLRLLWHTSGKGDRDVEVIAEQVFDDPGRGGERQFEFNAPEHPPSFSGRLISLEWALELTLQPGSVVARKKVEISPTGKELDLSHFIDDEAAMASGWFSKKFGKFFGGKVK